jgi:hypothetical protein
MIAQNEHVTGKCPCPFFSSTEMSLPFFQLNRHWKFSRHKQFTAATSTKMDAVAFQSAVQRLDQRKQTISVICGTRDSKRLWLVKPYRIWIFKAAAPEVGSMEHLQGDAK